MPKFPFVAEDNARQGFLEDSDYRRLLNALPDYLKALFVVGCHLAIRKGELLKIRWQQADMVQRTITLEASTTKNRTGRIAPILMGDMLEHLSAAKKEHESFSPHCPYVFSRHGDAIITFKEAWRTVCINLGFKEQDEEGNVRHTLLFHDLRRTAARNMTKAGIPQHQIVQICGWKTDSMFRRYSIVDAGDVNTVRSKYEAWLRANLEIPAGLVQPSDQEGLTAELSALPGELQKLVLALTRQMKG